jgi:DNA-binding NtrC family response regulator
MEQKAIQLAGDRELSMLIVEDEDTIRFALGEYFTMLGYRVDSASEWEEAEALLASRRYSLVLTDLRLSGFGGTEGLEIASSVRHRWPETLVILISGYGSAAVETEARKRGIDAFLHKPVPLSDLACVVSGLLSPA